MDQQVPTRLNSKVSKTFCELLEHESQDRNKERSRRQRRVSQRFLNIYKNSEMSHIDRQVRKLSTMADQVEPDAEAVIVLKEEDPVMYLDDTSSSSHGDVQTVPDDSCSTSCTSDIVISESVHQISAPKEKASCTPRAHSKQCHNTRNCGKVMSVFKGRRGRPPKPLWVKIPRLTLTIGTAMEAGSFPQAEMNLERSSEVSETSSVTLQALPMSDPTVVQCSTPSNTFTTFTDLNPLACVSSGDLHQDHRKLRSRPPPKRRRVNELEDTAQIHQSYSLDSSISSSFGYACDGFGDSTAVSPTSELALHVPLLAGKRRCSEKEEEDLPASSGVMEAAVIVARSPAQSNIEEDKFPSFMHDGLVETAHHAFTYSTTEKEYTDVCLSGGTQNSALQSTIICSVPAKQDPQFSSLDAIPTESDSLSMSIPKETLGALWQALNANPPIVAEDMGVQENEFTRDHPISTVNCLVRVGTCERNGSSPLVISPAASIHSQPCYHAARENHGSGNSSSCSLDSFSVEAADSSEYAAPLSNVTATTIPSSPDSPSFLPLCQNHNTSNDVMTSDTGCDKACAALTGDGQSSSSCTNMEVHVRAHPTFLSAKAVIPNQVPLVECSDVEDAVDGDEDTHSNVGSNQASLDGSCTKSDQLEIEFCAKVVLPDSGSCSTCLFDTSRSPKECSSGSSVAADHMEDDSTEDNTTQQKRCQPWQPATDSVHAEQVAMKMDTLEASETGVAISLDREPNSPTPAGESPECSLFDGSCTPALCESEHHLAIASDMATDVTTVEEPNSLCIGSVEAIHDGSGDSAVLIANEVLNSSGEANIEERGVMNESPMRTDPFFNDDGQEIKAKRPQREQARRRRNEKAFLYDENLVDLILAEHEALLPLGKSHPKPNKGDQASTEPAKTYLRRRGLSKASKQKDVRSASSSEAVQSKGSSSKLTRVQKQKDSWFEKGSLLLKKQKHVTAASEKLGCDKHTKKKAQKVGKAQELARAKYSNSSRERVADVKGPTSPVKLAIPKVPFSSKGRRTTVSGVLDADVDHARVKPKLSKEGKQAAGEYLEKSSLEPPPPRSKNYWRTAQAWLPRKVPETRQEVVALREESHGMKTRVASKSHLEENNGWRWLGDPISVSKYTLKGKQVIRSYFIGMRRGKKQTEDILDRDCVLVFSGDVSKFPYVGRIVSLWQDSGSDEMMFTTAWYHRPIDVLGSKPAETYSDRELFASSHQDDNPVASILCKCFVMGYNEYCRFRGAYCGLQSMVKSRVSDVLVPNPSPRQLVNFHIPDANSEIDLSHVFYCKNSLVSARHHTNKMKTDQRMRLKYMQKGVKPRK